MTIQHRSASYHIEVENPDSAGCGIAAAHLDDAVIESGRYAWRSRMTA